MTQTLTRVPVGPRPRRTRRSGAGLIALALVVGAVAALLAARFGAGPSSPPHGPAGQDGFAWLPDPATGEALQVDAATGRLVTRVPVAAAGQVFQLAQSGQSLVVLEPGASLSIVDTQTLAVRGRYPAGPGAVLLADTVRVFVADLGRGSVVRLDQDARPMGVPWSAGAALLAVALDGEGTLWALRGDGALLRLVWTDGRLVGDRAAPLTPAGAVTRAVLVAHERGVTMVAPDAGVAQRTGTGADASVPIPRVPQVLRPVATAPAEMVPVSLSGSPTLLLITGSSARLVDLRPYGCDQPGPPVVLGARVYVPCLGVGRVIPLDTGGTRVAPVLTLGPGDPILVVDEGKLFATVPGATSATMVSADGTAVSISFLAAAPATVPLIEVTSGPPAREPPAPPASSANLGPPPSVPVNATARARVDGTVVVTFTPADGADSYAILRGDTGATATADLTGPNDQGLEVATVKGLPVGATLSLVVEARNKAGTARSAPTKAVTVVLIPGAPMNVKGFVQSATDTTISVVIDWDVVPGQPKNDRSYFEVVLTAEDGAKATYDTDSTIFSGEPIATGSVEGIELACAKCGVPPKGAIITAAVTLKSEYVSGAIASATSAFLYCDEEGKCSRA
ncbi:MAG TPA: hypothetical protein VH561_12860 [Micromonosporaceae bacterium]